MIILWKFIIYYSIHQWDHSCYKSLLINNLTLWCSTLFTLANVHNNFNIWPIINNGIGIGTFVSWPCMFDQPSWVLLYYAIWTFHQLHASTAVYWYCGIPLELYMKPYIEQISVWNSVGVFLWQLLQECSLFSTSCRVHYTQCISSLFNPHLYKGVINIHWLGWLKCMWN